MTKQLREKVRIANKYGYKLMRHRNHLIFKHPNGHQVTTSKTTSDCFALRKIEAEMKRGTSSR